MASARPHGRRWHRALALAATLCLGAGALPGGGALAASAGAGGRLRPGRDAAGTEILAYWSVFGNPAAPLADFAAHAATVTWLSPYWYTLHGSGALVSHETDHLQVLAAAAAARVPVLPLVNQGPGVAAMLATVGGRRRATASIVGLMRSQRAFAGVVVDFEQLGGADQADFTAFVRSLRAALPAGDVLGVAVMPKSSAPGPGYARAYNYAALGRIADFVQVMTYDRHSPGGPAGPISPNNWVARVARYAASVIPPHKVLIGVPGYGYDWVGPSARAATLSTAQAVALAGRYGVTPVLDARSGEYHFRYVTAAGVRHTVWFESAQGVAGKYRIVRRLGLGGLALWTVGGEQPSFWSAATGASPA